MRSQEELHVRHVRGRYPHEGVFSSDNIVASVTEVARVFRIRLDDEENPDMWLEITVEVDVAGAGTEVAPCEAATT